MASLSRIAYAPDLTEQFDRDGYYSAPFARLARVGITTCARQPVLGTASCPASLAGFCGGS
jgi:hypothetical protein